MPRIVLQPNQVAQLEEAVRIVYTQQDDLLEVLLEELRHALEGRRDPEAAFEFSNLGDALNAALVVEAAVHVETSGFGGEGNVSPHSLQDRLDLDLERVGAQPQSTLAGLIQAHPYTGFPGLGRFGVSVRAANRVSLFSEPAFQARVTALLSVYLQEELDAYLTERGFHKSINAWRLYTAWSEKASHFLSGQHFLAMVWGEGDLEGILQGFIHGLKRSESPLWTVIGGLSGEDSAQLPQSGSVQLEDGTRNLIFSLGAASYSIPAPSPLDEFVRLQSEREDVKIFHTSAQGRLLEAVFNTPVEEGPRAYRLADPGSLQWGLNVLAAELGMGLEPPLGVEAQSPREPAPFPWERVGGLLGLDAQDLFSRIDRAVAATPATDFVTVQGSRGLEFVLTDEALLAMEAAANRPEAGSPLREVWDLQIAARRLNYLAPEVHRSGTAGLGLIAGLNRLVELSGETADQLFSHILNMGYLEDTRWLAAEPVVRYIGEPEENFSARVREWERLKAAGGLPIPPAILHVRGYPLALSRRAIFAIGAALMDDRRGRVLPPEKELPVEARRAQRELWRDVTALDRDIEALAGRGSLGVREDLVREFFSLFHKLATGWGMAHYLLLWNALLESMDLANSYAALTFRAPDGTAYVFSPRLSEAIIRLIAEMPAESWAVAEEEILRDFSTAAMARLAPYIAARYDELNCGVGTDSDVGEQIARLEAFADRIGHPIASIGPSESETGPRAMGLRGESGVGFQEGRDAVAAAYLPPYDWHSDAHERYAAFCAFSRDSGQPIPNALTAEALAIQLEVRESELRPGDTRALELLRDTSGDAGEQIARWTGAFAELMGTPFPGRGGASAGRPLPTTNVFQFTSRGAPSGSFSPVH